MVTIQQIRDTNYPVYLLDPEGEVVGEVKTYLQFLDIRCQIKDGQLQGYAFSYLGETIPIYPNGEVGDNGDLFGKHTKYLLKLM